MGAKYDQKMIVAWSQEIVFCCGSERFVVFLKNIVKTGHSIYLFRSVVEEENERRSVGGRVALMLSRFSEGELKISRGHDCIDV